jgi:hypothetical protein
MRKRVHNGGLKRRTTAKSVKPSKILALIALKMSSVRMGESMCRQRRSQPHILWGVHPIQFASFRSYIIRASRGFAKAF